MNWLRVISREAFGLFVDDGNFALAILVWLAVTWLAHRHLPLDASWSALLLFGGLTLILLESTLRRARRS